MKKIVIFLFLLAGFTACSLSSLSVETFLNDTINSDTISTTISNTNIIITNTVTNITTNNTTNIVTNIITNTTPDPNPDTGNNSDLSTNTAEKLNLEILKTFNISTAGFVQYNTNHGATAVHFSGSYNWYLDDISSPTKIIRTLTYINLANINVYGNIHSQLISQYTAAVVPSSTFTSFIHTSGGVVTVPSGGIFVKLVQTVNKSRYFDGTSLTDWIDFTADNLMLWIKPVSDNAAIFMGGKISPTNSSQFIFDFDPEKASYYIKQ